MKFKGRISRLSMVRTIFVTALLATTGWAAGTRGKPERVWDMRLYNYSSEALDYSTIGFLSENFLLVVINQELMYYPHPLFEETPDAILVLFGLRNGKALRTSHMPMVKGEHPMAPVLGGYFLVLTLSEVKLCSLDFHCDRAFATKGPVWLSSDGAKVVVGGNLMTQKLVLDSGTLAQLGRIRRESTQHGKSSTVPMAVL